MARTIPSSAAAQAVMHLEAERALHGDLDQLCEALDDPTWLGQLIDGPPDRPDLRRVRTDLAFTLHRDGQVLTFRKAALVDIGRVRSVDHGCAGEIGWRAASLAPLFPVFAGRLYISPAALRLDGFYAPPGGGVGLLMDRVLLHHVAHRTANWFLDRLAEELDRATT